MLTILEDATELNISHQEKDMLCVKGLIYPSESPFYHLSDGVTWEQIDYALSKVKP